MKRTQTQSQIKTNSQAITSQAGPFSEQKKLAEELKTQWKQLWQERVDDKVKAEGIAITDYSKLFVEQGTIIHATRDFKALSFKEILEQHQIENTEKLIPPHPNVGGWNKFIKTNITGQNQKRKPTKNTRAKNYQPEKKEPQQPKKGGRGWLHQ